MKHSLVPRLLALTLAALMILSTVACEKDTDSDETTGGASTSASTTATSDTTASTDAATTPGETDLPGDVEHPGDTDTAEEILTTPETNAPSIDPPSVDTTVETQPVFAPDIEKKNYNKDFNIVIGGTFDPDYIVLEEEMSASDALDTAVYERTVKVLDHLGVTCALQDAGDWIAYSGAISRMVQAGDDDYQLVLTHVYQGVPTSSPPTRSTTWVSWKRSIWTRLIGPRT